jgi:hypothetical protein
MRRLTAIQRSRGHVTLAAIKSILPMDSMTPEEIGQTLVQLEEAGIDIEVDKVFLRRRPKSRLADVPQASHSRLTTPDAKEPMSTLTDQGPLLGGSTPSAQQQLPVGSSWWRPLIGRVALVILVLAVLCLLLVFIALN